MYSHLLNNIDQGTAFLDWTRSMGELRASKSRHLAVGSVHVVNVNSLQLRTLCTKHQFSSILHLAHRISRIHRSRLPQHRSSAHLLLNPLLRPLPSSLLQWQHKDLLNPSLWTMSNCDKSLNQFTTESLGRLAHLPRWSLRESAKLLGQDYLQCSMHWQTKARWSAWWIFCTFINYKLGR